MLGILILSWFLIAIGIMILLGCFITGMASLLSYLAAFALILAGGYLLFKNKNSFELKSKNAQGFLKIRVISYSSLPQFQFQSAVNLVQNDSERKLELSLYGTKNPSTISLSYNQISSFSLVSNYNVPATGYSGGSETLLGAMTFGVVGAVVGSALGSNVKTISVKNCLVLNFIPKDAPSEIRTLFFGLDANSFNKEIFMQNLRDKTNAQEVDNSL